MIRLSDYVKVIAVSTGAAVMVIGLGGCGNTVKGIGSDIYKLGEKWSKPKEEAPVIEKKKVDVPVYEPKKAKKGQDL